jgi:hypothetical protein
MFLLQMNFQEFEGVETVFTNFITILEMARKLPLAIFRRGFVPSVILDVMVVADMLIKVILALEPVVASIFSTMKTRIPWHIPLVC